MVRVQYKYYIRSDLDNILNQYLFYKRVLRILARSKPNSTPYKLVEDFIKDVEFDYYVATADARFRYTEARITDMKDGRKLDGNNSDNNNEAGTRHCTCNAKETTRRDSSIVESGEGI